MNITKVFGPMDPGMADSLDMVLSDRAAARRTVRTPEQQAELDKRDGILEKMAGEYFQNEEERIRFLDMTAFCESGEVENAYLCGIRDGMKFQKVVDQIVMTDVEALGVCCREPGKACAGIYGEGPGTRGMK